MTTPNTLCPLCGDPLVGQEVNEDHVFGNAFGAHTTVTTHRRCNSNSGEEAEGKMHAANSYWNFIRMSKGLSVLPLNGVTTDDNTAMKVDLDAGGYRQAHPNITTTDTDDLLRIEIKAGTVEQAKKAYNDQRKYYARKGIAQLPEWKDLPPEARSTVSEEPRDISIELTNNVEAAEFFLIKTALDAGIIAFGESFPGSVLAQELRIWRDAPFDNPLLPGSQRDRLSIDSLEVMEAILADINNGFAAKGENPVVELPPLNAEQTGRVYDLIFAPIKGKTAVFCRILGTWMPDYGLLLDAPLSSVISPGGVAGPILVREEEGEPISVIDFTELMLRGAIAAANVSFDDQRPM